ncbi:MAG: hypothetical protein WB607_22880 [Candidatus Acidiferrum sp.]
MCGSELSVAAFAHPVLKLQPLDAHIAVQASLARLFGRVMPLWMAGFTLRTCELIVAFLLLSLGLSAFCQE